ncbi:cytochrome p450 family protein [Colletotrichum incanum]|uniref:Cytochrome p450 family protein n=1 Tax=Colletotrichum incanum TaxID=1573173 RepID=A0A166UCX8_COLIC|nr:cytochrome p450 family protein [Colletotrichum incanum]
MSSLHDQDKRGLMPLIIQLAPVIVLFSWIVYQRIISPFSKVPGPYWASLSRTWLAYHSYTGDLHVVMMRLHEIHGKVVRIAPSEVSISDLSSIKTIYGAGSNFRKSAWYSVWQGRRIFDLFPERDESVHAAQRRLVSRPYAMTSLKGLEPYVDNAIGVLLEKLGGMLGKTVDLGNWVQLFAFDVIGEVTFSKRFGFMDVGADDGSFGQIETALRSAAWIGQVPWLYWLHDYLSPVLGNWLGIASRHGSLRKFAALEVAARQDRGSDHQDILAKLLIVHHEKPGQFDGSALVSMAASNIFAGSDTTAISIRSIIYHLLKNPETKRLLLGEIDEHWRQGKLSDPVIFADSENMPYLQAVMQEALRVHPAVGMTLPRVVPKGGYEIDGHYMPAGSVVGVNPWVVHRSEEVYGQDVYSFRPERWLKENSDMHRFFFAFGSGARICLGRNISWMEMAKLIPTLFLHFDLELADPDAVVEEKCYWFVSQKGLNVKLRRRQPPATEEARA